MCYTGIANVIDLANVLAEKNIGVGFFFVCLFFKKLIYYIIQWKCPKDAHTKR